MLSWIKGGKSDHPLDDKDASGTLLEELSGKDPVPALEQISAHLDAVKTAENLKPGRAYEIVDLLDRTGRPLQRRLNQEFVAEGQRLTKFQEARLWGTLYTNWTQLAEGYRFCLAKYEVGAVGAAALKPHLRRITCRALRACAGQIKWTLLRYGPVEPRVWHNLGGLYLLAESQQFAQLNLHVYRGAKGESSPEREFLHALMLAVSSPDGLLPAQIDIADRVIAQLASNFRIASRPAKGIHYVFDVLGERPPGRLPTNPMLVPSTRCFGPGQTATKVEEILAFVERHKVLPPDLALGGDYDPALVGTTLRHLQRYWAPMLPERKGRRRRQMERVTVVHEYEEVVANVGGLFLESPFVSNDEEWVVENESEGGFGAFVPQPNGAWLKIGNLIGIRREDGVSWGAGIVRRVTTDEKGNRYVGIQLLARGGAAVTILSASMSSKDSPISPEGELCVLLPSATVRSGEVSLLMRAGLFSPSRNLIMHAYDREYLLFPLGAAERSEEFDVGRYRILEQLA